MTTNCKNCGAALKSGKCEYCGTEYNEPASTLANSLFGVKVWRSHVEDYDPVLSMPNRASKINGEYVRE